MNGRERVGVPCGNCGVVLHLPDLSPHLSLCRRRPIAPCPFCAAPLRTDRAHQCRHCRRDGHDPGHVREIRPI